MHYFIIIAIIVAIVIIQICFFVDTRRKINNFLWIFPEKSDEYKLSQETLIDKINSTNDDELDQMLANAGFDSKKYYSITDVDGDVLGCFHRKEAQDDLIAKLSGETGITVNHDNSILTTIVNSINDYLKNNKSVSDFHLMKDIVDRNCDAKEEEINTQIPIPLYMGLVGTMAGILVGILYLWLSGGIGDLLSAGSGSGADGVEALLGGVALAMISSILGIVLTTWGSNRFKNVKSIVENDKHNFLSWIQAHLLPVLSANVADTLERMSRNLTAFNETFSSNTEKLGATLAEVNKSYSLQTQLFEAVKQIADKDVSFKNLQLYNALKNSAQEIDTLATYLNNTNEYLANVKVLNEKLDLQENRTRAIEEMGAFFKTEIEEIEARKIAISEAVGKVDDYLQQALTKLKDHTDNQFLELQTSIVQQHDILRLKAEEINELVSELKQLSAVKESILKFADTMQAQNSRLDKLANTIRELAQMKTTGIAVKSATPQWVKIGGIVVGGLISAVCLIIIIGWITNFIN